MTRISLLLVSITASLSLGANQSQEEKSKFKWPWEVQIGANFIGYDSRDATGPNGTLTFSPSNPRLAPSIRLSIDPICLSFGSILFSAGYKLENDVPLDYGQSARSDLKHKNQMQIGALLRIETSGNFEFGVGADVRYDWMKASHLVGTMSQDVAWRPWLRANARYMFDKGTRFTPFVGIEAAYALSKTDVDPQNYYRDYAINTGDTPLGSINVYNTSPDSFARGNFPAWEAVITGGIRFGRRDNNCAPARDTERQARVAERLEELNAIEARHADAERQAREAERLASEAEAQAREAERLAREAEAKAEAAERERLAREEQQAREPVAQETRKTEKVVEQVKVFEIESLMIHFPTNGYTETAENRAIVKNWAAKYKNVLEPGAILITGHCDANGTAEHNKILSVNRANSLAESLRREGIVVPKSNIIGHSYDKPIADNNTPEGQAKNRRAELGVNNSKYKVISVVEGKPIVER
ncbi:MAG: OmpA family protein [Holophagales bacterium]|jgi:outer membrane protein OmpA-like peptidoglycan-associated protein/opacity protein-like surface antigen|nr:OmpA family protein [Holophagales bacterium]